MQIIGAIFLIIFLIALLLFSIALSLLPSAINLFLTALCLWPIWKLTRNAVILAPIFISLSFVFAMNVRLIDVISDLIYYEPTKETSIDNLILSYGSSVSLKSNIESISYKKSPLSTPVLSGNEGCMCTYYVNPRIITENIAKEITDLGLVIKKDSDVTIDISSQSDSFLTYVVIDIQKNGVSVASKKLRIRNRYHGDLDLSTKSRTDEGSMIHHLTKNTFWNFIY